MFSLIDWLINWMFRCLSFGKGRKGKVWLIDFIDWLADWLIDWMIGWLTNWLIE